jgi:hypothetical protein
MHSTLPDGAIRYERYLEGEHVRVRAHVYINGQDGPALTIRLLTEPLFAEGMHLLQMFSDLKGMRRL